MRARLLCRRHIATMAHSFVSPRRWYIGGYKAGRAPSGLAEVTPDEHCFARLPTLMVPIITAMAA